MKKRGKIGIFYVAVMLQISVLTGPGFAGEVIDDPRFLAERAVDVNPSLHSVRERIRALEYEADSVEIFRDPVISLEYSNVPVDSFAMGDSPMTGIQFSIRQTLPFPGKNDRRRDVAAVKTEAWGYQLDEQQNMLRAAVEKAYWNLTLTRQLRAITERHVELVGQLIDTVRFKYQIGKVEQHELLRMELLRKMLRDDLADYDLRERQLTAEINGVLHRAADVNIGTPADAAPVAPLSDPSRMHEVFRKNRPLLAQLQTNVDIHRKSADLAEMDRWPDLTVMGGYRVRTESGMDPGTDFITVGVSIPIPFDFKHRYAAMREDHATQAAAAQMEYDAAVDRIATELEVALAAWERAYQKTELYRSILIPEAEKTLKAAMTAYQSDLADFSSLYQSELQLLEFDRSVTEAGIQTRIQRVTVAALIGRDPQMR
ncbi:TolC family protein [bacterium]|nr:TolC family protein [candidate division CSSED10-310 bacterium]